MGRYIMFAYAPNWKCDSFNVDSLIFSARRVLFVLRIRDLLVPTNVNSLNSYSIVSIQSINPLVVSLFSWQVCWTGVLAHLRSSTVRQMYPVSTLTMDFSSFVIKFRSSLQVSPSAKGWLVTRGWNTVKINVEVSDKSGCHIQYLYNTYGLFCLDKGLVQAIQKI